MKNLLAFAACGALSLLCVAPRSAQAVPAKNVPFPAGLQNGLVLHLDADNAKSLLRDDKNRLAKWKDLSPARHDAVLASQSAPQVLAGALNGRAVLRFSGSEWFKVDQLAEGAGGLSVFAVFRRLPAQASERRWQRVLSGWDGITPNDNAAPSFLLDTQGTGEALAPTILSGLLPNNTYRGALEIGRNAAKKGEFLEGDLAEVLVYNKSFLTYDPIQAINQYFIAKWGVVVDTQTDWTRSGPLPTAPKRTTDKFPLSDQANKGGWTKFALLSDEWNQAKLDTSKWWDHNPNWYGRAPSRYVSENVTLKNGNLGIVMSIDESLPVEKLYKEGAEYRKYAAGSLVRKTPVLYGYFEIRARAMNSAASSAFWLAGNAVDKDGKTHKIEIDVFEIGGKAPGFEHKYNMNAHVFQHPQSGDKHWSKGGSWIAPFALAESYHVYGLEWTPEFIRYFVDGVLVRSLKNTHWHAPMNLIFDTETMGDWLGMPDDKDLPSIFDTDYLRVWKNAATRGDATRGDWKTQFTLPTDSAQPTKITEYVRSLEKNQP